MNTTLGSNIQDYKVVKELGNGGFGKVFKAVCLRTEKEVAIKEIDKSRVGEKIHYVRNEISIHKSLDHSSVVKLYTHFEDERYVYIVLELCGGGDLHSHIKKGVLSEAEARHYIAQVVEGVLYMHDKNVIHRDISLKNLLLDSSYKKVKIADFGLSKRLRHTMDSARTMVGTPNFMSPEVVSQKDYGPEVDEWAVGVVLHVMLIGKAPFESKDAHSTIRNVRCTDYQVPDAVAISPNAKDLITRMLKKNKAERIPLAKVMEHPFMKNSVAVVSAVGYDSGLDTMTTGVISGITRNSFSRPVGAESSESPGLYSATRYSSCSPPVMIRSSPRNFVQSEKMDLLKRKLAGLPSVQSMGKTQAQKLSPHFTENDAAVVLEGHHKKQLYSDEQPVRFNGCTETCEKTSHSDHNKVIQAQKNGSSVYEFDNENFVKPLPRSFSDRELNRNLKLSSQSHDFSRDGYTHSDRGDYRKYRERCHNTPSMNLHEHHDSAHVDLQENGGRCHQSVDSSYALDNCYSGEIHRRNQYHLRSKTEQNQRDCSSCSSHCKMKTCLKSKHCCTRFSESNGNENLVHYSASSSISRKQDDKGIRSRSMSRSRTVSGNECRYEYNILEAELTPSQYNGDHLPHKMPPNRDVHNSTDGHGKVKLCCHSGCCRSVCEYSIHTGTVPVSLQGETEIGVISKANQGAIMKTAHGLFEDRGTVPVSDAFFTTRSQPSKHDENSRPVNGISRSADLSKVPPKPKGNKSLILQKKCSPVKSRRLKVARTHLRDMTFSILDSGEVCLENVHCKSTMGYPEVEVLRISECGLKVWLYRALRKEDKAPDLPPEGKYEEFTFNNLPSKYWKDYYKVAKFVKCVKAQTPKITYYSDQAKCFLMENSPTPNFEARFYDGTKIIIDNFKNLEVTVTDQEGRTHKAAHSVCPQNLPLQLHFHFSHAKQVQDYCLQLEKVLTEFEGHTTFSSFPVTVGRRPHLSAASSSKQNPNADKENVSPLSLQSFSSTNPPCENVAVASDVIRKSPYRHQGPLTALPSNTARMNFGIHPIRAKHLTQDFHQPIHYR